MSYEESSVLSIWDRRPGVMTLAAAGGLVACSGLIVGTFLHALNANNQAPTPLPPVDPYVVPYQQQPTPTPTFPTPEQS